MWTLRELCYMVHVFRTHESHCPHMLGALHKLRQNFFFFPKQRKKVTLHPSSYQMLYQINITQFCFVFFFERERNIMWFENICISLEHIVVRSWLKVSITHQTFLQRSCTKFPHYSTNASLKQYQTELEMCQPISITATPSWIHSRYQ